MQHLKFWLPLHGKKEERAYILQTRSSARASGRGNMTRATTCLLPSPTVRNSDLAVQNKTLLPILDTLLHSLAALNAWASHCLRVPTGMGLCWLTTTPSLPTFQVVAMTPLRAPPVEHAFFAPPGRGSCNHDRYPPRCARGLPHARAPSPSRLAWVLPVPFRRGWFQFFTTTFTWLKTRLLPLRGRGTCRAFYHQPLCPAWLAGHFPFTYQRALAFTATKPSAAAHISNTAYRFLLLSRTLAAAGRFLTGPASRDARANILHGAVFDTPTTTHRYTRHTPASSFQRSISAHPRATAAGAGTQDFARNA